MQAITVRDRAAGAAGLMLSDIPRPHAAENDVIVRVYAAGFTPGELDWPGTWTDRQQIHASAISRMPARLPSRVGAPAESGQADRERSKFAGIERDGNIDILR